MTVVNKVREVQMIAFTFGMVWIVVQHVNFVNDLFPSSAHFDVIFKPFQRLKRTIPITLLDSYGIVRFNF